MMDMTIDSLIEKVGSVAANIPQFGSSSNFWMIRTKNSAFYDEFLSESYVAIGWNILTKDTPAQNCDTESVRYLLKEHGYPDKVPGSVLAKCRRFIFDVGKGDIVMIVGEDQISFASIGDYFEVINSETTPQKEIEVHKNIETRASDKQRCPYIKRYHTSFISSMDTSLVPLTLYKSMVANRHSFSCMNDYGAAILGACYDLSYYQDRLIVKYHIQQPRDISPIDFSLFTLTISSLISSPEHVKITGKYNLNSEGDIILFLANQGKDVLDFISTNLMPILLGYFILFGAKAPGLEFPSAIDKMKEWVAGFYFLNETKRLRAAQADREEAEAAKIRAETHRICVETARLDQDCHSKANIDVENLLTAAASLDIKPPASNIIDLDAFFKSGDH